MKNFRTKIVLATLAIAFAIGSVFVGLPAKALQSYPSTTTFPARINTTHQTNYQRFTVNYNDPNIASGVKFARLPSNAFINDVRCHVTAAFNAGTTNVFTVGTSTSANEIIDAATSGKSIDETSATVQSLTASSSLGVSVTSGGEVDLYAKYAQTGTAATAGKAICVIAYIPDNDK